MNSAFQFKKKSVSFVLCFPPPPLLPWDTSVFHVMSFIRGFFSPFFPGVSSAVLSVCRESCCNFTPHRSHTQFCSVVTVFPTVNYLHAERKQVKLKKIFLFVFTPVFHSAGEAFPQQGRSGGPRRNQVCVRSDVCQVELFQPGQPAAPPSRVEG